MSYTTSTPIKGTTTITAKQARAYADANGALGDSDTYIEGLWHLAPERAINPLVLFAQWLVETDRGRSPRWLKGDPAGIGIFASGTASTLPPNLTGLESAAIHVAEMASKISGKLVTVVGGMDVAKIDPHLERVRDFIARSDWPKVETINDLRKPIPGGDFVWAEDQTYATQIAAYLNVIAGGNMQHTTEIPGLPGGPLITDYPITLMMLPASQTINRPGIKAHSPRRSVQHGNGNPNSMAHDDAVWLLNGARNDKGEPTQTSWHAINDDTVMIIQVPLDEVTYQAADGAGPGNMNGFSCEMAEKTAIWADPARAARAIHIAADFMGRCAARLGAEKPEQHWDFNYRIAGCTSPCDVQAPNRHNCPDKLRHSTVNGRPAWSIYANEWNIAKLDEAERMHAGAPDGYATPKPLTWQRGAVGTTMYAGVKVNRFAVELTCMSKDGTVPRATVGGKQSADKIPYHGKVVGLGNFISERGKEIVLLEGGHRVLGSNFKPRMPKP